MKQIGVTGGIGSGKSTVCRVFATLGVPVYYADERAKWLTEHDPILKADITRVLGPQAYDRTRTGGPAGPSFGKYNRTWVASQVFADPLLLDRLNAVIHPRVIADTALWVSQHTDQPYVIKEAALMRAAGDGNSLDKVVVVVAPAALRIDRVRTRDPHRSLSDIQHIIDRQVSDEERLRMADYVLHNDESQLLLPQIVALHQEISQLATV